MAGGARLGVDQHVEQRELHLAQRLHAALEVPRREHLVEQRAGQRGAGVHMFGELLQHIPLPAEVLHELAGQLDGVPLHAGDARHAQLLHLREHVVQPVAELVEQRDDVVVREQGRAAVDRGGEVAHEVRHRRLQRPAVGAQPARTRVVHPGARALAGAGVEVQVELAHQRAAALDPVEADALVPRRRGGRDDPDLEQRLDDAEQPLEHLGQREVLAQLLVAERVAGLLQALAGERHVPALQVGDAQLLGGELAQLGEVGRGARTGAVSQVAQEGDHFGRRAGHLGHQREFREVAVAQQPGFFLAQFQQFADDRRVVALGRPGLARAGDVGGVERLAQRAVAAHLHHRQVAGEVQRELAALAPVGLRGRARDRDRVRGHAREIGLRHDQRVAVRGVEHVLRELARQLGVALLDGRIARLLRSAQVGATELEVTQPVGERLAPDRAQIGGAGAGGHGAVLGVQAFVGALSREELGDARQVLGVRGAQFRGVGDAGEVFHRPPRARQPLGGDREYRRHRVEVGRHVRADHTLQRGVGLGEQQVHRRRDEFRPDVVEGGQAGVVEQGILHDKATVATRSWIRFRAARVRPSATDRLECTPRCVNSAGNQAP